MSNAAVGPVYDTIIAEVINAVRVDFEENGVDDGALEDLKKVRLYRSPSLSTSQPLSLAAFPPPCPAISYLCHQIKIIPSFRRRARPPGQYSVGLALISLVKTARQVSGFPRAAASGSQGERGGEQPIWVGDPALLGLFLSSSPIAASSPNHSRAASDWLV